MRIPLIFLGALMLCGCAAPSAKLAPKPVAASTPQADHNAVIGPSAQAELYLGVVDGLIRQQRYEAAIAFLAKYQKVAAPTPRFLKLTADALNGAGRYDESIATYRGLLKSDFKAQAYAGIGRAEAARGNWIAAEDNFRQAAMSDPANAGYLNNIGFACLQQNLKGADLMRAVSVLKRAHELEPDSALIRNNLALAEQRAGDQAQLVALLDAIPDDGHRQQIAQFAASWGQPVAAALPAHPKGLAAVPAKDNTP